RVVATSRDAMVEVAVSERLVRDSLMRDVVLSMLVGRGRQVVLTVRVPQGMLAGRGRQVVLTGLVVLVRLVSQWLSVARLAVGVLIARIAARGPASGQLGVPLVDLSEDVLEVGGVLGQCVGDELQRGSQSDTQALAHV